MNLPLHLFGAQRYPQFSSSSRTVRLDFRNLVAAIPRRGRDLTGEILQRRALAFGIVCHAVSGNSIPNSLDERLGLFFENFAARHTTLSPWNQAYTVKLIHKGMVFRSLIRNCPRSLDHLTQRTYPTQRQALSYSQLRTVNYR